MGKITEKYGELVFTTKEMKKRLSPSTFNNLMDTIKLGKAIDESIAEDIAQAIKEWALEHGASHFTHWFQPQRSGTAEKHDAFISYDDDGDVIEKFSASQLRQSEPDASSFPSGGIRSTFEARGYTAWDPASPVFLRDSQSGKSLVIPSIYMSWTGEALDMKTPLLRSIKSLNHYAIKLQRLLGNRFAKRIIVYSGLEQEYFLLPRHLVEARPDIMTCNRTVFGAPPVKGQMMEDHYFGSINSSVMNFMDELDQELYRYGIPVKTKHNEVAPNQFELAPLYEELNLAIDHNLLTMEIMHRVAEKFDFVVLHHEKPFAGLNGTGKHMNWSIGDNTGANYLEPSKSPLKNISFLMTLGALLIGVSKYTGLIRGAIADAGNEHRLGSHEAPPSILSIYLGDYLTEILDHIEGIKTLSQKEMNFINHGLQSMPRIVKDISDRNRTSPIAFTGNKFELRALGGSANGSEAGTVLNLVCAYGYKEIYNRLARKKGDMKKNAILLLKEILIETKSVRFEGNNYSDEWRKEAKKRGLYIADITPEAINYYTTKESIALFEEMEVLTKRELESRVDIQHTAYANTKMIEMRVGLDMVRVSILPAVIRQLGSFTGALQTLNAAGVKSKNILEDVKKLEKLYSEIQDKSAALTTYLDKTESIADSYEKALSLAKKGSELFRALRTSVDEAELSISEENWTLPRYDELLSRLN